MIKFELILEKCSLLRVIVFTLYALKINQFYNVSLEYFSCQVKCLKCECMHVNRPKQFSLHQSLCTSKKTSRRGHRQKTISLAKMSHI